MVIDGVDIRQIQRFFRHSSEKTTAIYIKDIALDLVDEKEA